MSRRNLEKEFNFDIYIYNYDDIKNIYSKNRRGAYEHWVKYGIKEGRKCTLIIKPENQEEYNYQSPYGNGDASEKIIETLNLINNHV